MGAKSGRHARGTEVVEDDQGDGNRPEAVQGVKPRDNLRGGTFHGTYGDDY
jgi:hypothetical protein